MVQVSYNISEEANDKIKEMAKKHFRSISKEINFMIVSFKED